MNYKNAKIVLPERLISEIQQYIDGEIIYIPSKEENKQRWGHKNGARQRYQMRNSLIKEQHSGGMTVDELAKQYFLTTDSIKKILKSANS